MVTKMEELFNMDTWRSIVAIQFKENCRRIKFGDLKNACIQMQSELGVGYQVELEHATEGGFDIQCPRCMGHQFKSYRMNLAGYPRNPSAYENSSTSIQALLDRGPFAGDMNPLGEGLFMLICLKTDEDGPDFTWREIRIISFIVAELFGGTAQIHPTFKRHCTSYQMKGCNIGEGN